jgi:hypothetical protein
MVTTPTPSVTIPHGQQVPMKYLALLSRVYVGAVSRGRVCRYSTLHR